MPFSLKDIFSKEKHSVLGVDAGASSIKVVQLRRERGQAVLETYGAIALGPYAGQDVGRATQLPADKITAALKDVLKEANVTATDAAFAIPYASSLISVVRLPAAVESRLNQTMPLEARKYIPVPITEVQLDWSVVGGGKNAPGGQSSTLEVMLVAIHNDTIAKYRQIAADSGLTASFLEIEVFSAVRASLNHGIAPVAVVDFGAATTKFYVVERGIVRESHIINHGSQELTLNAARALNITPVQAEERKRRHGLDIAPSVNVPAATLRAGVDVRAEDAEAAHSFELSLAPIIAEVSHLLVSFEQRMQETVSTVVCTGGGATLHGFSEYVQSKLQAEVRLADPFSKTETPAFLETILKEAGPEFSVAVGLALRRLQELG